jgi:hypothetical protein
MEIGGCSRKHGKYFCVCCKVKFRESGRIGSRQKKPLVVKVKNSDEVRATSKNPCNCLNLERGIYDSKFGEGN